MGGEEPVAVPAGWQEAGGAGGDEVWLVAVRDWVDWGHWFRMEVCLSWGTVAVFAVAVGYQW